MPTSRARLIAILAAGAMAMTPVSAVAFDPEKVFEDKNPNLSTLFRYFFSARKKGNEADAVSALKYAAEQGNHAAQWKLGRMYQIGDGVPKDPRAAYEFYRAVVDDYSDAQPGTPEWQFTSSAMVALGRYHHVGVPEAGIDRNPAKARIMFTTAATYFGNPEAQFELARLYLEGENNDSDTIQAARMLKSATAAGHAGAEALLGHMLFEGKFLRRDPVRGLAMMMNAQQRASGPDADWIRQLQEESFAIASEEERRAASEQVARLSAEKK